jgi:prephenate dehydrogenase
LALRRHGAVVLLGDCDPDAARTAASLGAGTVLVSEALSSPWISRFSPRPRRTLRAPSAGRRNGALAARTANVFSMKADSAVSIAVPGVVTTVHSGVRRLAGLEKSGPLAARGGPFEGRAWVLAPARDTCCAVLNRALASVSLCGGVPMVMDPVERGCAVDLISHAPHLVSVLGGPA